MARQVRTHLTGQTIPLERKDHVQDTAQRADIEVTGVHPYADKFPMLPDSELDELAESIKTVGLLHPIVVTTDGLILDGRNRLEACNRAEVEASLEVYDGDDFAEFVIASNVARRNMSTGARAMSTALVLAADGRRENGRWKRGSVDIGESANTASDWRSRLKEAGAVLDHAPALAQEVVDGHVALDAAYRKAQEVRDAERLKLERQERERVEEDEARQFVEANSPDLAAQVGEVFQSYAEAQAVWEKRNREEAARIAREKAEQQQREKEQRQARSDLYSGILRAIGTCGVYGKYDDIGALMDKYNPADLNPRQLERHLDDLELAQRFIAHLIEWRDQK